MKLFVMQKLRGCSFAAAEDLWMATMELRKLLAQPHSWYLLRNQQAIHVDKALQNSSMSVLL